MLFWQFALAFMGLLTVGAARMAPTIETKTRELEKCKILHPRTVFGFWLL